MTTLGVLVAPEHGLNPNAHSHLCRLQVGDIDHTGGVAPEHIDAGQLISTQLTQSRYVRRGGLEQHI